jgi:hypothetical protein
MTAANPPRKSMKLLAWTPIGKGTLIGRAKVLLPIGLEIDGIGLFRTENGARWAQLPSELMRGSDGQPLKNAAGKDRYRSFLRWSSKDLQERFSAALFALIEGNAREHRPAPPTRYRDPPHHSGVPDDPVDDLWHPETDIVP